MRGNEACLAVEAGISRPRQNKSDVNKVYARISIHVATSMPFPASDLLYSKQVLSGTYSGTFVSLLYRCVPPLQRDLRAIFRTQKFTLYRHPRSAHVGDVYGRDQDD